MNLFSKENLEKESFKGAFCRTCSALIPALDLPMALATPVGDGQEGHAEAWSRGAVCGALGSLLVGVCRRGGTSSRDILEPSAGSQGEGSWALLLADGPGPTWAARSGGFSAQGWACRTPEPQRAHRVTHTGDTHGDAAVTTLLTGSALTPSATCPPSPLQVPGSPWLPHFTTLGRCRSEGPGNAGCHGAATGLLPPTLTTDPQTCGTSVAQHCPGPSASGPAATQPIRWVRQLRSGCASRPWRQLRGRCVAGTQRGAGLGAAQGRGPGCHPPSPHCGQARREPCGGELRTEAHLPCPGPQSPSHTAKSRAWAVPPCHPPKVHEKPPAQGRTWGLRGELWRIGVCVPVL